MVWVILLLVTLIYHWYSNGILMKEITNLHKRLSEYEIMYDQIMMRGALDLCDTKEYGYMWLSDTGLVWTEYQPERCSSIYMPKDEFVNKWAKWELK